MLSIHEGAHIAIAVCCHYSVDKIIIYPFGLAANIMDIGFGNLQKETMIIVAGPLMHALFPSMFAFFHSMDWISTSFFSYLVMINGSILLFNLLPIYPLDGGRLVQVFFHCFLRFELAQKATFICSLLSIGVVMQYQLLPGVEGYVILLFLLLQIYLMYKQRYYTKMRFLHYRYKHRCNYPIILNTKEDLYRGRYNIMCVKKGWLSEETWLNQMFKGRILHKKRLSNDMKNISK